MPKGGFGNLIALPLQKEPRDLGRSVFVDANLQQLPDQWAFLENIRPLPQSLIETVLTKLVGDRHPLDIAYRECIVAEGPGDYAIRYCLQVSLDDWEKELGRSYDALLHMLPPNSASAKQLKHTQKLWEKFRKTEFSWIEMQNSRIEGTMYEQIMLEEKLAIVRERALQIFWYQQRLEADS